MSTKKQLNPSDFFTVPAASEGRKLLLSLPDGSETDQHLIVLGIDSQAAQQALKDAAQLIRDESEEAGIDERANLMFRSALVVGWSFKSDCTPDAVRELLSNNPQLAVAVEQFSVDRRRFYGSDPARS